MIIKNTWINFLSYALFALQAVFTRLHSNNIPSGFSNVFGVGNFIVVPESFCLIDDLSQNLAV
jgi:hypothetical protein